MFLKTILQVLLTTLTFYLGDSLSFEARSFLTIFVWVVFNWLFTNIPLYITGLIGVTLSVLFGIEKADVAFASLADPIIMLFLSGFLFAKAMQRSGLDRRISLNLLTMKWIKGKYENVLLIIMATTAFFSMWVSNTATAAMMLPLVIGIISEIKDEKKKLVRGLTLTALAYSASIGGIGTPIGSPPNIIAIGFLKKLAQVDISFLNWMTFGVPTMLIALLISYLYILRKLKGQDIKIETDILLKYKSELPKLSLEEKQFSVLFVIIIFLWFQPFYKLNPGAIGILMSSLLFIFPLKKEEKILKANDISHVDWSSLLLFGTGLSLGKILFKTGLAELIGNSFLSYLESSPLIFILLAICFFTIFFTEVASNTATANILIPIVIAFAIKFDYSPEALATSIAISSSLAFMLPVATPPNAIVFGTGLIDKNQMAKFGLILNLAMTLILPLLIWAYYH